MTSPIINNSKLNTALANLLSTVETLEQKDRARVSDAASALVEAALNVQGRSSESVSNGSLEGRVNALEENLESKLSLLLRKMDQLTVRLDKSSVPVEKPVCPKTAEDLQRRKPTAVVVAFSRAVTKVIKTDEDYDTLLAGFGNTWWDLKSSARFNSTAHEVLTTFIERKFKSAIPPYRSSQEVVEKLRQGLKEAGFDESWNVFPDRLGKCDWRRG